MRESEEGVLVSVRETFLRATSWLWLGWPLMMGLEMKGKLAVLLELLDGLWLRTGF